MIAYMYVLVAHCYEKPKCYKTSEQSILIKNLEPELCLIVILLG